MNFNSYIFTLLFFPTTITCYFFLCKNKKYELSNYFLLAMSIIFYGYCGIKFLAVLIAYLFINYFLYIKTNRNKIMLIIDIVINVAFLFVMKYTGFVASCSNNLFQCDILIEIAAPLAISFYTFSQIMFIVDSFSEDNKISFCDYCLYILYFPKLIQGPLVKPQFLIKQFHDVKRKEIDWNNIDNGFILFILGLAKKVLVADILAKATNWGFSNINELDSMNALIVVLSFTFQIYFDFSGYSDMAKGISTILNIELPDNFNYPYTSTNISEFWKKWHITLTNFLTKYIYIPLGGNRKGEIRTYVNILIVFTLSGLWHGPNWNYVLWGLANGILLVIYKKSGYVFEKLNKSFKWMINFLTLNIMWTIFRTESVNDFFTMMSRILSFTFEGINSELQACFDFTGFNFVPENFSFIRIFQTSRYYILIYLVIALVLSLKGEKIKQLFFNNKHIVIKYIVIAFLFVYSILSFTGMNPFIYAGF